MDPEQALLDARTACEHWHNGERGDHDLVAFDELVSAFEALDQWLSKGGFLPQAWHLCYIMKLTQPLLTEHTEGK